MLPSEAQIRMAAYHRWECREHGHGYDVADWLAAEQDLIVCMNYQVIARYALDEPKKQYIGDVKNRCCRYCGKRKPQVTFRKVAHALPEAIGNKSLIAHDECDACNTFFSATLEDSLGKLLLPLRNILAISGKQGVPVHRSKDKRSRIEFDPIGNGFQIKDGMSNPMIRDDVDRKRLIGDLATQPYVPVRVLKCLAKMAIAMMPEDELPNFRYTIDWIMNPDDRAGLNHVRGAGCYLYFLPQVSHRPNAMLMRRTTTDTPLPYMIFTVAVCGVLLQCHVPVTPMNNLFAGRSMTIPRVGAVVIPGRGVSHCETLPLDSPDWVKDGSLSVELVYESRHESAK